LVLTIVLSGETLAKSLRAFGDKPLGEAYLIYSFGQSENVGTWPNYGSGEVAYTFMEGTKEWTRLGATAESVANHEWADADPEVTPRSNAPAYQIGQYGSGYGSVALGLAQSLRLATGANVYFFTHSWSGQTIVELEYYAGTWSASIEEHIAALQSDGTKPTDCPAYPDIVTYSQGWQDRDDPVEWSSRFRRFYDEANDSTLRGWSDPINTHWVLMDLPQELTAGDIDYWSGYTSAITYINRANVHYMSTDDAERIDQGIHIDGTAAYKLGEKVFRTLWGLEMDSLPEQAWRIIRAKDTLQNTGGQREATGDGNPASYNYKVQASGTAIRVSVFKGLFSVNDWFALRAGMYWRAMETGDSTAWRVYEITSSPKVVASNTVEFGVTVNDTGAGGEPSTGVAITSEAVLLNWTSGLWVPAYVYSERSLAHDQGFYLGGGIPALYTNKPLGLGFYADSATNLSGTASLQVFEGTERALKYQAIRPVQINENLSPLTSITKSLHVAGMTNDAGMYLVQGWRENQYLLKTSGAAVTTTLETFTFANPTNIIYEIDVAAYRITATGNRDMFRKKFRGGWSRMGATTDYATVTESTDDALAAAAAGVNFTVTANVGAHTLALACVGPTSSADWSWNVIFRWRNLQLAVATTA